MIKKITNWFFRYKRLKDRISILEEENLAYQEDIFNLKIKTKGLQSDYEILKHHLNLGIDVSPNKHDPSWAVVCLNGKDPVVKFYDLRDQDVREIDLFLRNFDVKNKVVDAPYMLRQFLNR